MKSLSFRFFPFYVIKEFNLKGKHITKLSNSEIFRFVENELKTEKFAEIKFIESKIEFKGNYSKIGFRYESFNNPFNLPTQAIDYGCIKILHSNDIRKLVYKFQLLLISFMPLTLILIAGIVFKNFLYGLLAFSAIFILVWLWAFFSPKDDNKYLYC